MKIGSIRKRKYSTSNRLRVGEKFEIAIQFPQCYLNTFVCIVWSLKAGLNLLLMTNLFWYTANRAWGISSTMRNVKR